MNTLDHDEDDDPASNRMSDGIKGRKSPNEYEYCRHLKTTFPRTTSKRRLAVAELSADLSVNSS